MSEEKDKLLDHEYDGIRELDNRLPRWWLYTFYATCIFGVLYFVYYHMMGGPTLTQEFEADMAAIKSKAEKGAPAGGGVDVLALAQDSANAANGKLVYDVKCGSCHGPQGQGLIGPNLTDKFWIHGKGTAVDIVPVVAKGVPEKGMPAWETMLKPEELGQVVAFVVSLKGTNPPNPKAPQGNAVE